MVVPSSIFYQNEAKTAVLLDLPRSIAEAQEPSRSSLTTVDPPRCPHPVKRTLVSAPPPASPFPTPEPRKSGKETRGWLANSQSAGSPSTQVAELMALAAVEAALKDITREYDGPWCLPRVYPSAPAPEPNTAKSGAVGEEDGTKDVLAQEPSPSDSDDHNKRASPSSGADLTLSDYFIPEGSHYLLGTVESQRETFLATAPPSGFDLIVMDPPWPNRSAKRKRDCYQPVHDFAALRKLLSSIPVASHLSPNGLVAIWVTNSAKAAELLTQPSRGIFDEWGIELVGEWTWLKVTSRGEPIVSLESGWRKPWERLLIARKRGGSKKREPLSSKVIVTVPDVHSRKPNLRCLFEELLPPNYQALEVFARSLTAGWWSWGDEVLLFQHKDHWVVDDSHEPPKDDQKS